MFSNSGGTFSNSCSFICTPNQSSGHHPQSSSGTSTFQFGSNVNVAIEVTTTGPEELRNRRYKLKCAKIQKHIREMIFMNGSLQGEMNEVHQRLEKSIEERQFLLNKLLEYEKDVNQQDANCRILHQALSKKHIFKQPASSLCLNSPPSSLPLSHNNNHSHTFTNISSATTSTHSNTSHATSNSSKRRKVVDTQAAKTVKTQSLSNTNEIITKKVIQAISLDASGKPLFPIIVGGLTVHSLGEVVSDRDTFHTQDYIFPVGFCSSRIYASMKNPKVSCLFTCKITDNEDAPSFEIVPEDDPDSVITGLTADDCLRHLLSAVCPELLVQTFISPGRMGAAFFGYSLPTIQNLIQSSPGARRCVNYKWIKFEVSKSPVANEETNESKNAILNFDALQAKLK